MVRLRLLKLRQCYVIVVKYFELLQEDKYQNSMRTQSSIIWSESFPETKESFLTYNFG